MPRRSAIVPSLSAVAAVFGRWGAWLGALALVLQLLTPLTQVRAATWAEDGLFPPACAAHVADDGSTGLPDQDACGQCPLCQLHAGDRLLAAPLAVVTVAYPPVVTALSPERRSPPLAGIAAHPPLPSRGPPSVA